MAIGCEDCGTKLDHGICPNCNELDLINLQESWGDNEEVYEKKWE